MKPTSARGNLEPASRPRNRAIHLACRRRYAGSLYRLTLQGLILQSRLLLGAKGCVTGRNIVPYRRLPSMLRREGRNFETNLAFLRRRRRRRHRPSLLPCHGSCTRFETLVALSGHTQRRAAWPLLAHPSRLGPHLHLGRAAALLPLHCIRPNVTWVDLRRRGVVGRSTVNSRLTRAWRRRYGAHLLVRGVMARRVVM
jgi:hypothetical protein